LVKPLAHNAHIAVVCAPQAPASYIDASENDVRQLILQGRRSLFLP